MLSLTILYFGMRPHPCMPKEFIYLELSSSEIGTLSLLFIQTKKDIILYGSFFF